MQTWQSKPVKRPPSNAPQAIDESPLAALCLQIVDACFLAILFLAPLFFGGRHLLGRFVFILLATVAATAWFTRQTLQNQNDPPRTWANALGLAMILCVALQLLPLPLQWLQQLAPRSASLLTLWTPNTNNQLGLWQTLTLTPSSTKIALATLIAYVLLFTTAAGRLQQISDIERLIRWIALATVLMATFGILQYYTSNGLFFWFYQHPHSTTSGMAKGSFTTPNHFAHFIALGVGPLLAWIALQLRNNREKKKRLQTTHPSKTFAPLLALHAGLGILALAALLSLSRGGILALAVASTITVAFYFRSRLLSSTYLHGLFLLGFLIVGALSLSGYEKVTHQIDDLTAGSLDQLDNNQGRQRIWTANLAAIQKGSLFGSGAGSHREIYPLYLPEPPTVEYTHAENGYLQIATENGLAGIVLLTLAIAMIATWCWQSLRNAASPNTLALAGAITASLATSLVHSAVDFVWFIPACMSLTLLLAACALRLAQLTQSVPTEALLPVPVQKFRRFGITAIATAASLWAITTTLGPATASLHWDSYLRSAVINKKQTYNRLVAKDPLQNNKNDQQRRTESMIRNLKNIITRDPHSARAHLRLAAKTIQLFNQRQAASDNAISVEQIRGAAFASQFSSAKSLNQWLTQAFGKNSQLLYRAHYHAKKSLHLCPLQGEGYLLLANLCFLEGNATQAIDAYLEQSLRVRPHDGGIVFQVGRQRLVQGQGEGAFQLWQQIYPTPGLHQLKIIGLLAGQIPAEAFLQLFEPNWKTLHHVWQRFRLQGSNADAETLITYAQETAQSETLKMPPPQAASIWRTLSNMQAELNHPEAALASMHYAYRLTPSNYPIRRSLAQQLLKTEHYQQAEPHLRWCLARHPNDVALRNGLVQATKSKLTNTAGKTTQLQYQ